MIDHVELETIHNTLLSVCFPDGGDEGPEGLIEQVEGGLTQVFASFDDQGAAVACAVGELFTDARTVLLSSLAVVPPHRGKSHGTRIYQTALREWVDGLGCMVLAEVEDPAVGTPDPMFGDPEARIRFYDRHGAQHLAGLPYFSPASLSCPRQSGLLLLACAVPQTLWGPEGPNSVNPVALRRFLRANVRAYEGQPASDGQMRRLVNTARTRHGRALSPLGRAGRARAAA